MNKTYEFIKRGIDLTASIFGLVVTSPILIGTTIAIKLESEGPALFKQERIGMNGKPFTIYKFRSMVVNKDADKGFSVGSLLQLLKRRK